VTAEDLRVGQVLAVGFAFAGFRYSPMLLLIASFVFLGAQAEYDAVRRAPRAAG